MGNIHSIETFSTVDGPGIRLVVFMQGCPLRCKYCHNPDSWSVNNNTLMTKEDILKLALKYKPYFKNGGGVTFSGGEPLFQGSFLASCLKILKENGIDTCIDTCGVGTNQKEVLKYTDLIILDIKEIESEAYKKLVNHDIKHSLDFLDLCQNMDKPLWIRQVIIPGYNDTEEDMNSLANFLKTKKNIERIELLPYHSQGEEKYKKLNISYPLDKIEDMNIEKCKLLEDYLLEKIKNV